jgi:hypothetical protein
MPNELISGNREISHALELISYPMRAYRNQLKKNASKMDPRPLSWRGRTALDTSDTSIGARSLEPVNPVPAVDCSAKRQADEPQENHLSKRMVSWHVLTNCSKSADLSPLIATLATTGIAMTGDSGTTRRPCARAERVQSAKMGWV